MVLLSGKELKESILENIKNKVCKLKRKPTLAVISTILDSSSEVYINSKRKMCDMVGYEFKYFDCINMSEDEIVSLINKLNNYDDVDGILLQFPVREDIDSDRVVNSIDYRKDVDGITDINMGKLLNGKPCLCSCTALGIMRLLDNYSINVSGKNVVVLGRSRLIGKSLIGMLLEKDATVTLCHSKTKNLDFYTKNADILIVAIDKMKFIKKEMIKDNSIVIDVGIHKLLDGSLVGDVDFIDVCDKVGYITPVPLGVGQMTVAMLCQNVYDAYINRQNLQ